MTTRFFVLWKLKTDPDDFWSWKMSNVGHDSFYEAIKEAQEHKDSGAVDYKILRAEEMVSRNKKT